MVNESGLIEYQFGPFRLFADQLLKSNTSVPISETPLRVLRYFVERSNRWISTDELVTELYGKGSAKGSKNAVHGQIKRLRNVLGDSWDQPQFIQTRRRGTYAYRFIAPVRMIYEASDLKELCGTVTRPVANEHVPRITLVEGRVDALPTGTELWLVIEPKGGTLYPAALIVVKDQRFQVRAYVGTERGDQGIQFGLHIVACSRDTSDVYRRYVETAHATSIRLGLSSLAGGHIVASVPVIRDDTSLIRAD